MNRRDFLKIAASSLLALAMRLKGENDMIQKDIWRKLARGQKLSPQEEFQFVEFGGRLQQLESAVLHAADGGMKLGNPLITSPRFETSPLSVLTINRQTDTSITQDVDTEISFENAKNGGQHFTWEPSAPTVIGIKYLGRPFLVTASVAWAANATGYRNAKVNGYDKNGNSLGNVAMFSRQGSSAGVTDDTHSAVIAVGENDLPTMSSVRITVAQGSGAPLTLKYILVALFIL